MFLKIYLILLAISIALMALAFARIYEAMKGRKWKKDSIPERIRAAVIILLLIATPCVNVVVSAMIGLFMSKHEIEFCVERSSRLEGEDDEN